MARKPKRDLTVEEQLARGPLDLPFLMLTMLLLGVGLIMMFSASFATAYYNDGDPLVYIKNQAVYAAAGVVVMFLVSKINYQTFRLLSVPGIVAAILLLVLALSPLGVELNEVKRWVRIGPIQFQPSEVAKFAVIVLFAHIISINHKRMKTFAYGVLPFVVILGVIAGLMLLEPHLSGTVLILGIGGLMMFVGGTGLVWFGLAIAGVVAGVAGAVVLVPDLVPYAMSRIESWQNPWLDAQGDGHQIIQSMYAIGSGGLTGLGIGNSKQKHLYLPEPQNDFIFSVICEELGFIGALLVIFLFVALLLRGIYVAWHAKDKFGSMLVVGVIVQVTLQAVLNIAVVTKTIPNTGISLPFFSYGGTSLLMLLGEMGVVLSVSRQGGAEKV